VESVTYNPLLPEVRRDPYPTYRALRESDPVHRSPFLGAWVLTRYRDVAQALRDDRMSVDGTRAAGHEELQGTSGPRSMLVLDPPDHTRLRALVSKAFTPRAVERVRPRIEALVTGVLDRAALHGGLELVDDLAYPLPVTVIAEMLGVPPEDWPRFRGWSRALVANLDPLSGRDPGQVTTALQARGALGRYLSGIIDRRRQEPGDDLISGLLVSAEGEDVLSQAELVVMANLLLVAGHETTVNLIANGTLALLEHRQQLALLAEQPDLIQPAVEELLRWDSPVQLTARVALEELDLAGQRVGQGESVLALLGAANRDPDQFTEPDLLDITRAHNPHLAFGRGIHFCLGAPLARLEAQIAIAGLVTRFPGLRLAGAPERRPTVTLRGLTRLPLVVR
jgi:cytochrome P450